MEIEQWQKWRIIDEGVRSRFPDMPDFRLGRLIRLIDDVTDTAQEALEIVEAIPATHYGTFRLDVETKRWVVFCDKWGRGMDH